MSKLLHERGKAKHCFLESPGQVAEQSFRSEEVTVQWGKGALRAPAQESPGMMGWGWRCSRSVPKATGA